jgi:8-oxo-dGTP diphosphatase
MTVVAAAVVKGDRVLVVRRAPGQKLEGKWEFPGGKVEAGETERAALSRELREELSILGDAGTFVGESDFEYAFGVVRLRLYRFLWQSGEIALTVHDQMDWVTPTDLARVDFAPADVPLAALLAERMDGEKG